MTGVPPEPRDGYDARAFAAGALAYIIWGLLTLYWHELEGQSAFEIIGQRIVWSALLLAVLLSITRRWPALRRVARDRHLLGRVALAAVLLTANWTAYVWAVTHHNVIETALGYFIAPLGTVAIGVIGFHERLRRAPKIALGLAGIAVVLLTIEHGRIPVIALVLGCTWGLYGLIKRVVPLHPIESLAAETFVLLPVALVTIAIVEHGDDGIVRHAPNGTIALVLLTGVVTVVPLLMFAYAAPRVPFTILGPLQYFVPCINFVLGVAVYHEEMSPLRVAGFALVWLALVIFTVDSVRVASGGAATPRPALADAAA
jgi:chloramphenicol-sensitive protein RarD